MDFQFSVLRCVTVVGRFADKMADFCMPNKLSVNAHVPQYFGILCIMHAFQAGLIKALAALMCSVAMP